MTIIAAPAQVVPRDHPKPAERDGLETLLLYLPLIGVTLLAKFSFKLGGSEIIMGVPIILGSVVLGVLTGRLRPHPVRLAFYLMLVAVVTALTAFTAKVFILSSLILILAIPVAHAFQLKNPNADPSIHLQRFRDFALFICLIGIAQYCLQFVIGTRFAFPLEHFPPPGPISITKAYNTLNPLRYGSPILKSNGVFLLEPSYYSQMMALGFTAEAAGPRRLKRLACFCGGFIVAYSGTGFLMLGPALAVLILAERRFEILAFLLLAVAVLVALAEPLGLDLFTDRLGEFQSTKSSAYMRYIGGWHLFEQYLWPNPERALFGLGAGMMYRTTPWPQFFVAETGWVKILVEFGLVGFVVFFGFLYFCIFTSKQPLAVRACIGVTPLLSGILDPWSHALMLTMLLWMPTGASAEEDATDPLPDRHTG